MLTGGSNSAVLLQRYLIHYNAYPIQISQFKADIVEPLRCGLNVKV